MLHSQVVAEAVVDLVDPARGTDLRRRTSACASAARGFGSVARFDLSSRASASASRIDCLHAERPPIEILGRRRLGSEIGIVVIARQRVVHRARDRAEALGVVDERVGHLAADRRGEVRPRRVQRVAPRVGRAGEELPAAFRDVVHAVGVLEAQSSPSSAGVLRKRARVREKARDLDVGMHAGLQTSKSLRIARSPKTIDVLLCSADADATSRRHAGIDR